MSLFAKECMLRHPRAFRTTNLLTQLFSVSRSSRHLSTSPHLYAAKRVPNAGSKAIKHKSAAVTPNAANAKAATLKSTTIPTLPNAARIYKSYAEQLALKTHPTLLYQAPSNTLFKFFSYMGGLFCIAYSGYNIYVHYLHPPVDLAKWVVYSFGGIAIFMSAFGTWLFLGPSRMIKTITAIPKRLAVPNANSTGKIGARPEVEVEIELSKMLPIPFFPARKLIVRPDELSLSHPITQPPPSHLTVEERHFLAEAEKKRLKELQDYEDTHVMTRPFRHFGRGAKTAYNAAARTWLREGFVNMKIKGGNHKLDVSGGWALDGGKALDRLVNVKPRVPSSLLS